MGFHVWVCRVMTEMLESSTPRVLTHSDDPGEGEQSDGAYEEGAARDALRPTSRLLASGSIATGRPTIKDVARMAGVSFATVSRVVNANVHVSDETRRRVQRAIDLLGYERNEAAAELRRGRGPQPRTDG